MSTSRVSYLYCDGPDCGDEPYDNAPTPGETVAEMRERAARYDGWVRRGKRDLCRNCAAGAKQ